MECDVKMSYVILEQWAMSEIINLVCEDNGSGETKFFDSEEEARKYAEEELNGDYKIVEW